MFSAPSLPTLGELLASTTFDWSSINAAWPSTSIDYGDEVMRFLSIQTGSGAETTGSDGLIDLIEIKLKDGRSLSSDLEP